MVSNGFAKRKAFLAAFEKVGNITAAARMVQMERTNHNAWLQDPEYRRQFEEAKESAADLLVEEARKRAVDGIDELVIYQGEIQYTFNCEGETIPVTVKKYSDPLLMFLIRGARPETYRDTWKGEIKHSGTVASVDLSKLTDVQLEQLRAISSAACEPNGAGVFPQIDGYSGDRSGDPEEGEE